MCRMASLLHKPNMGDIDIKIYDLESHGNTEKKLNLDPTVWAEGHYLPSGEIELRLNDNMRVDKTEYETQFKNRFPTFISFFNWAVDEGWNSETVNLSSLKSAEGLKLPSGVKTVNLSSLESAEGLKLPSGVKMVNLSSLESAEGLKLPSGVKTVILTSLKSAEGLKLPSGVKEVNLYSLKSAEGLKLPSSVEYVDLSSLKSAEKDKLRKKYSNVNIY